MQLSTGQCHLFAATTAGIREPGERSRLAGLLDAEERARCARFRTDALQARYTLAHGLLRQALGQYTSTAPVDLRFIRDRRNRPALDPRPDFDFNLSYTIDLIAFAVASVGRLGCDVEQIERRVDWLSLAPRVLSKTEQRYLHSLAPDEARRAFLEIWVLKEAYSKALGIGIEMTFNGYTLMHSLGEIITDVRGWQFVLFAHNCYRLAVVTDQPVSFAWRLQPGEWSELARRGLEPTG